jgi:6-phosphogluconolactonase (cycloisomerase 2 family)
MTIDPTGLLIYIVNFNTQSVAGYQIDTNTGTPSSVVGGSTGASTGTGAGPNGVVVDPALGTFLYTSDSLDNTVTAKRITPNDGSIANVQNSPFPGSGQPTAITAVPNGSHATQIIQP